MLGCGWPAGRPLLAAGRHYWELESWPLARQSQGPGAAGGAAGGSGGGGGGPAAGGGGGGEEGGVSFAVGLIWAELGPGQSFLGCEPVRVGLGPAGPASFAYRVRGLLGRRN